MKLMTAWLFIYEVGVLLVVHAKHNRAVDAEFQHSPCSERGCSCSLGAYIFLLYGGAVSWTSKRQQSIALSSSEAEYMAQTQASKEAIWLSRLLSELDVGFRLPKPPVLIKADNQGAIALTKDPRFHSRTKHIDI